MMRLLHYSIREIPSIVMGVCMILLMISIILSFVAGVLQPWCWPSDVSHDGQEDHHPGAVPEVHGWHRVR